MVETAAVSVANAKSSAPVPKSSVPITAAVMMRFFIAISGMRVFMAISRKDFRRCTSECPCKRSGQAVLSRANSS